MSTLAHPATRRFVEGQRYVRSSTFPKSLTNARVHMDKHTHTIYVYRCLDYAAIEFGKCEYLKVVINN